VRRLTGSAALGGLGVLAATLLLDNPHGLWHNDTSALCLDGPHSHSEYFYFLHSGKKVATVVLGHDRSGEAPRPAGPLHEVRGEGARSVLRMRCERTSADVTEDVRLFVRGAVRFAVAGRRAFTTDNAADGPAEVLLGPDDLTVLRSGPAGVVYALP